MPAHLVVLVAFLPLWRGREHLVFLSGAACMCVGTVLANLNVPRMMRIAALARAADGRLCPRCVRSVPEHPASEVCPGCGERTGASELAVWEPFKTAFQAASWWRRVERAKDHEKS